MTGCCDATAKASPRCFDRGRGRIHRHPNSPTPKIWFFFGFRPLYFENVGKCKKKNISRRKVTETSKFLGGRPPRFLKVRGPDPSDPRRRRPCVTELLGGADRSAARRVWAGLAHPDLGRVTPGCPPRHVQSCTEVGRARSGR